jgi:hypothetical protein
VFQVDELVTLFNQHFNYKSKIVELDVQKKAQHQLNNAITSFVLDNDGPNNLLIVYYTGHGTYRKEESLLEFAA